MGPSPRRFPMAIVNLLGASCTNFVNSILPLGSVFSPCFYYLWLLNFCLISTFCIFFSSFVLIFFLWCIFASHISDEIRPWIYPSSYPVHSLLTSFYWRRLLNTLSKKQLKGKEMLGMRSCFSLSLLTVLLIFMPRFSVLKEKLKCINIAVFFFFIQNYFSILYGIFLWLCNLRRNLIEKSLVNFSWS